MTRFFLCLVISFITLPAHAETVLYCKGELATGFTKKNGAYIDGKFELKRFTLKFNKDFSSLEGLSFMPMECSVQYPSQKPNLVFCIHSFGSFETFQYSKISKRFLFNRPSSAGYAQDEGDTDNMYAGTCANF